ncbi:MAG: glycosyltransferase family 39 protein [bacterium]|nr:MAG: glycosyltransferase family 39 protein [bacterium]
MKNIFIVTLFCFLAFLLFSFRITEVPPGINGDEVGIAHNAALMSKSLTDENNNFLPLFIFAKTSDWKQPVTVYTTAAIFKVFGVSFAALRMTSVLFVVASIIIFYFLSKEVFNLKFFLVGFIILITTPIIMIQSHLALENIAVLPFIFLWLLMLVKQKKPIHFILAGAFLGAGIFSYLGMRIIVPVLSLITLIYLRKSFKQCVLFLVGVLPFFILLYVANFYYPSAVVGSFSSTAPSFYEFALRYLSVFDLSFMFLKGDISSYHSTGKSGMFLIFTLPLFLAGVWDILKRKKPFEVLILCSFFLLPLLFGFVPDIYRASRLLALVPFYVIISTIGYLSMNKIIGLIIMTTVLIGYWFFVNDYWFEYAKRVENIFPTTINYYDQEFVKK